MAEFLSVMLTGISDLGHIDKWRIFGLNCISRSDDREREKLINLERF